MIRIGSGLLGSARFGSARLSSAQLGSARLGSARFFLFFSRPPLFLLLLWCRHHLCSLLLCHAPSLSLFHFFTLLHQHSPPFTLFTTTQIPNLEVTIHTKFCSIYPLIYFPLSFSRYSLTHFIVYCRMYRTVCVYTRSTILLLHYYCTHKSNVSSNTTRFSKFSQMRRYRKDFQ